MSSQLEAVLKQAQGLSLEDQLELIRQLTQVSTQPQAEAKPKRKVTEFLRDCPQFIIRDGCSSMGITTSFRNGMNVKLC
jgi:hypothetical protein